MATPPGKTAAGVSPASAAPERRSGSRARVDFPVRVRYDSVIDFVETQSMNISRTGMFISTEQPAPLGSRVGFEFGLSDGFTLLTGTAEVVRVVTGGVVNGMGIRFLDLDDNSRRLIDRIVSVNDEEGRNSTLNFDFSRPPTAASMPAASMPPVGPADVLPPAAPPEQEDAPLAPAVVATERELGPISFDGRNLRVALGPLTVPIFTQNPLLNVRSGGLFLSTEEDVPLGTIFQVEIVDGAGSRILAAKGKVVAKQELRVGMRLVDADKDAMARLRVEVGKLTPAK